MSEADLNILVAVPAYTPEKPATDKADLSPEAALELIRAGKSIENVRIKRLKLRGVFDQPIRFRNCLLSQCEFASAEFKEPVAIINCTLDRPSFVKTNVFGSTLDLASTTVKRAGFSRITVKGKFLAQHTEFHGNLRFTDCTFAQGANFWEAQFHTWVDIKNCTFGGTADFRSIHAHQGFVINGSTFLDDFLFRGGCVEKKFEANGARFEKSVDLSKAKLFDFAYLESIKQGPEQTFLFLNALADRIRIRPAQVEGRLASEKSGRFDEAMQEYGLLKSCFQALHRFDDEDWAFYRFKVCQRKGKPQSWQKPWTIWRAWADWLFLDIGCSYGTSPLRAVRMALVIVLGFAALYAGWVELFHAEHLPFDEPKESLGNRLMIGLTTSVSVFTSGMGGIRDVARGWMNVPVMIESIMGTLLFGLFIVAFSRKVIR